MESTCFPLSPLSISRSSTPVFQHIQYYQGTGKMFSITWTSSIANCLCLFSGLKVSWENQFVEMNFGEPRKLVLSKLDRTLLPQNQWQPTGNPLPMDGLTTAHVAASEKSEWKLSFHQKEFPLPESWKKPFSTLFRKTKLQIKASTDQKVCLSHIRGPSASDHIRSYPVTHVKLTH